MLQLLTLNVSKYTGEELESSLVEDRFIQAYFVNTITNTVEVAENLSVELQPDGEYYLFDVELGLQWLDLEIEERSVIEFFKTTFTAKRIDLEAVFSSLPNSLPSGGADYPTKDYLVFNIYASGEIEFIGPLDLDRVLEKIPYLVRIKKS